MKLLITGGCGFLGSNLAQEAMRRSVELVVFDNLSRSGSAANLEWLKARGKFSFVKGDIRNQADVVAVVKKFQPEAIFHLAGQVAMTTSIADPKLDFEINALGTLNLLEAVKLYAPQATLVYSSTNKVYGDLEQYKYQESDKRFMCQEKPNGFDEATPLDFHSPYGCSKGAADQYMLDYARIFGLKTIVFRHSSIYGSRQFSTFDQGWIGWFCQKALETKAGQLQEPFTISGTGKQVRDVLHASDAVDLYFSAITRRDKAFGQAFNISAGIENSLSLLELFFLLEDIVGVKLNYQKLPPRQSDQLIFVADNTKARQYFDWQVKVDKVTGIKSVLEWLKHG